MNSKDAVMLVLYVLLLSEALGGIARQEQVRPVEE